MRAGPARPPPPPPVTCLQAPSHRNDRSPLLAWPGTGFLALFCTVREPQRVVFAEVKSAIHRKVKLPLDLGEVRRGVPCPGDSRVCPKSLFLAVHPRWGQPGHGLLAFLAMTIRE